MRILGISLALAFLAGLLYLAGCGSEQPPAPPSVEQAGGAEAGTGGQAAPQEPREAAGEESARDEPAGEEPGGLEEPGGGAQPGLGDPEEEESRIMPKDPYGILIDPEDTTQTFSYWRDAKVGDWVRFLTHQQKIAVFTVVERNGNKLKYQATHFELNGKEIPSEQPDLREVDIEGDEQVMRSSLIMNYFVTRRIYDWELYNTSKILHCERRTVDNPTGENNETCYAWEVRCGGYVYQRRGRSLVVLMVDYGDVENPPKWGHLDAADLLKYWYKFDRFLYEPIISQADPPEGEFPEPPEEPAPQELAGKLKEIDQLVRMDVPDALKAGDTAKAAASLDKADLLVQDVLSYAKENNYKPAIAEAGKFSAKTAELRKTCAGGDKDEIDQSLEELRGLVDRLFVSVNCEKEDVKKR
jgi:hypothetical protein